LDDGRNSPEPSPKKWPASVDLQASKKTKGLQEQQSQRHSNMPSPPYPNNIPGWEYFCMVQDEARAQFTGEKIQSKGKIRRSLVFDTFPCQPHRGFSQAISSSPKIFIASFSESAGFEHFRCKLILCPSFGHAKTILYALLMPHNSTLWLC
jgi:hypothetical protein